MNILYNAMIFLSSTRYFLQYLMLRQSTKTNYDVSFYQ